MATLRLGVRWLAIIGNLLWGSLQILVVSAAWLSKDSITGSEERVAYVTAFLALLSVIVLLWGRREV